MRDHPISPVTEPLQYRAIGIVRGKYRPNDQDQITRGHLVDADGLELDAVVLGRVMTLIRRHLDINKPHLWVVYPRCRDSDHLHLQIAGIWEPSTLGQIESDKSDSTELVKTTKNQSDELQEGDDYFSIRGELIYTKPASDDLVIKIRQQSRANGSHPLPFKLNLKGSIPLKYLRNFVSLDVRRNGTHLCLEDYKVIAHMPTRGGKKGGDNRSIVRKVARKPREGS